jgi:hypothetical protein
MVVLIPGEEYYSLHITTLIPNNIDGGTHTGLSPYQPSILNTIYPHPILLPQWYHYIIAPILAHSLP